MISIQIEFPYLANKLILIRVSWNHSVKFGTGLFSIFLKFFQVQFFILLFQVFWTVGTLILCHTFCSCRVVAFTLHLLSLLHLFAQKQAKRVCATNDPINT
jgi:hypothetical protein